MTGKPTPSSAHNWGGQDGCTAFVSMHAKYPDLSDRTKAEEGIAAHKAAAAMLLGTPPPEEMDPETVAKLQTYVSDVQTMSKGQEIHVEEKITCSRIHPESEGYIDVWSFVPEDGTLYIWDLKWGNTIVDAFEFLQGICYAGGLLERIGMPEHKVLVQIRIVQPNSWLTSDPISTWTVRAENLRPYINQLETAAHEAMSDSPTARSGPQCLQCNARHDCQTSVSAGVRMFEAASEPTPLDLTPEALGKQLKFVRRACKQLEAIKASTEQHVNSLVAAGESVPGWELSPQTSREKWTAPTQIVEELGTLLGLKLTKIAPVTPNQARALGIPEDLLAMYSRRPKATYKLTEIDAKKRFRKGELTI